MNSPLNGVDDGVMKSRKSMKLGLFGSVRSKNSSSESNVVPMPVSSGRKKTPCRKMLNELKKEKSSKLAPPVSVCRPAR